jgi:hypothetical protein
VTTRKEHSLLTALDANQDILADIASRLRGLAEDVCEIAEGLENRAARRPSAMKKHKFPPVTLKAPSDTERMMSLVVGAKHLAKIVKREKANLSALRALQRRIRSRGFDVAQVFDNPIVSAEWAAAIAVLERAYCEAGPTIEQDRIDKIAAIAERELGVVSGHRVHVAGGGITDPGDFYPFNRSFIEDEIENYGLAPESVRLDEIPLAESKRRKVKPCLRV